MPSPQSIDAREVGCGAKVLASVKVPTTVAGGRAMPVLGVSRVAGPAVRAASAMIAEPLTTVTEPPSSVTVTV